MCICRMIILNINTPVHLSRKDAPIPFYYTVCLLLAGVHQLSLSFMMSGCRQQSVQLIDGWVNVPVGPLLFSYMSSQASCFYTWHITMCWQINLGALNGAQQDNVTHNNDVKHTERKKKKHWKIAVPGRVLGHEGTSFFTALFLLMCHSNK